jgi:hypothetical protein
MKLIILVLSFFLVFGSTKAQITSSLPHTNTYCLKKLITENLTELENKIVVLGKEKIFNVFIDSINDTLQNFFYNTLKDRLVQYNLVFNSVEPVEFKIYFSNLNIKTEYPTYRVENLIGNRYIVRVFTVKFTYKIIDTNKDSVLLSNSVKAKYQDKVLLDYIDYIQDQNLYFARAELPKIKFIDQYLVPTIMILISGLAIVLFFTIRSK